MTNNAYVFASKAEQQPKLNQGVAYGSIFGISTYGMFENGNTPPVTNLKYLVGYMLAVINNNIYYAGPAIIEGIYGGIKSNYKYMYGGAEPVSCLPEISNLEQNCYPIAGLDGQISGGVIGEFRSTQYISPYVLEAITTYEYAIPNVEVHTIGLEVPENYLGTTSETEVVALAYGTAEAYLIENGKNVPYTGGFTQNPIFYSNWNQLVPQEESGTLLESPATLTESSKEVTIDLRIDDGLIIDGSITCADVLINSQSFCNMVHGLLSDSVPVFEMYKLTLNKVIQCKQASNYSYYNNMITTSSNYSIETITYLTGVDVDTILTAAGQQLNSLQIRVPANTPYTKVKIGIY